LNRWIHENNLETGVFQRFRTNFGLSMDDGIHLVVVFAP